MTDGEAIALAQQLLAKQHTHYACSCRFLDVLYALAGHRNCHWGYVTITHQLLEQLYAKAQITFTKLVAERLEG